MYVSLTHLRLKSVWKIFQFYKYNSKVQNQIKEAHGVLSIEGKGTSLVSFFTKTSWESKEEMLNFMRSGAHADAMKNSPQFAHKINTHGYESDTMPSWTEAIKTIKDQN